MPRTAGTRRAKGEYRPVFDREATPATGMQRRVVEDGDSQGGNRRCAGIGTCGETGETCEPANEQVSQP